MNVVLIVGNLTRDPELRYTTSGKAVTRFTVAVSEGYGEKRTTQFLRCTAWEKVGESVAERARKGSKVAVEGRLTSNKYTDKSGQSRESTEIVARTVSVLTGEAAQQRGIAQQMEQDLDDALGNIEEPLPF